jgi:exopolysaccharide biosynthesis polyprenyl glycosylphosphotransferase
LENTIFSVPFRYKNIATAMNKRYQVIKYIVFDFLTSVITWSLFYTFRKEFIESPKFGFSVPVTFGPRFIMGLIIIPSFWLFYYYVTGFYKNLFRRSRMDDFIKTFIQTFTGVIIIFFLLILDDEIRTYTNYYLSFIVLFSLQFILTLIPRLVLTTQTVKKIHSRKAGFNTLLIGSNQKALDIYTELMSAPQSTGNLFIGFISLYNGDNPKLLECMPNLGSLKELENIIEKYKIEEVIIALDSSEHDQISMIINKLSLCNVIIKAIPDMYDILTGKVKMDHLFGTPLIQLSKDLMPVWQANLKQFFDIAVSTLALIFSLPLIIVLSIGVKMSSRGPIFYSHERIGRYGKPFQIYKFRSMRVDAEVNGPELSSKDDNRLTNFGRFMRKFRLDEIPNFYNVLKGDMSLVGPRPERQFYIDQIIKKAPHYSHLHKVKPGITSWGQVKYGYAENVDQMIKRLQYDILYIENMSLFVDLKILVYTILTIIRGRGI